MHRLLLLTTGFGASLIVACLLVVNAHKIQTQPALEPAQVQVNATYDEPAEIQFPYRIYGTDLVLEKIASYDGPFLEDGTDREVFGISAAVLRNAGQKGIDSVKLILHQQNQQLVFYGETVPPGESVLILEMNKSEYIHGTYHTCYLENICVSEVWNTENIPELEPVDMGSIRVTNHSNLSIENLWLYYKTYLSEPGIYIGGITYKVGIRRLESGQTLLINPPKYANGYSRIARIKME